MCEQPGARFPAMKWLERVAQEPVGFRGRSEGLVDHLRRGLAPHRQAPITPLRGAIQSMTRQERAKRRSTRAIKTGGVGLERLGILGLRFRRLVSLWSRFRL